MGEGEEEDEDEDEEDEEEDDDEEDEGKKTIKHMTACCSHFGQFSAIARPAPSAERQPARCFPICT